MGVGFESKAEAGVLSGKARREKQERKSMAETFNTAAFAKAETDAETIKAVAKLLGKSHTKVTVVDVGIYKLALAVMKGDKDALLIFRDMLGEKPADKVTGSVSLDMNFDFVVEPEEEDEGEAEDADGGVE